MLKNKNESQKIIDYHLIEIYRPSKWLVKVKRGTYYMLHLYGGIDIDKYLLDTKECYIFTVPRNHKRLFAFCVAQKDFTAISSTVVRISKEKALEYLISELGGNE